jgi:nicotinamidase-related amidase
MIAALQWLRDRAALNISHRRSPSVSNRTLLLIDVQRNMLLPPQPVPDAPAVGPRIAGILERARRSGAMVIHVRNNGRQGDPDAPGTTGWELIHEVAGHEAVVDKRTPDGFAGTELGSLLTDAHDVVIVGMQSECCVRETSLAALQRGLAVSLVRGAHATYGDGKRTAAEIAAATEDELAQAGARILDADDVTF